MRIMDIGPTGRVIPVSWSHSSHLARHGIGGLHGSGLWHTPAMQRRSSMPRDLNELAHKIGRMATGQEPPEPEKAAKNPAAVALGKLGGKKGGKARARSEEHTS